MHSYKKWLILMKIMGRSEREVGKSENVPGKESSFDHMTCCTFTVIHLTTLVVNVAITFKSFINISFFTQFSLIDEVELF